MVFEFAEDGAIVLVGFWVDDIEDATFRDDENVAESLAFGRDDLTVFFWREFLIQPGGVLSVIVGGMVGDDEAAFCG